MTRRPPLWLKVTSTSGLLMTLLYIVFAVFPIIKVDNALVFGLKITLVVVLMNVVGYGILVSARKRAARPVD